MYDAGKNTQEHPGMLPSSSVFLLLRRDVDGLHAPGCARGMFSVLWAAKGRAGSHWKPPHPLSIPFLHPLISRAKLLSFVYVLGDKTQTRNGNGSEMSVQGCAGSSGLWFQHMHLAFCNILPLHPVLRVDSKGMIHPDKGAHGFFNAKHLLCKMWETGGEVYFFLSFLKNSLLLPTPLPILRSWDRDFPMRKFAFMT